MKFRLNSALGVQRKEARMKAGAISLIFAISASLSFLLRYCSLRPASAAITRPGF